MNNTLFLGSALALLIGGIGGYCFGSWGHGYPMMGGFGYDRDRYESRESAIPAGAHRMPDGSIMGNGMGMGMMDHMMMVSSEREFITEMIPHHEEAVKTAKEVLARGGSTAEIRTLAENIIAAQEKEIANMKSWYQTWYGTAYQPSGNYQPMMRDLSKLSGKELDRTFLEDMIPHHMGAIMMAHSVQAYIEHEEIRSLTADIVTSQSSEIQTMRLMLQGL